MVLDRLRVLWTLQRVFFHSDIFYVCLVLLVRRDALNRYLCRVILHNTLIAY